MKRKTFNPTLGDNVACLYDGKYGRAVVGTVLKRRGFATLVRFTPWALGKEPVECWFVRLSSEHFGGYYRKAEFSVIRDILGGKGDWYNVVPIETKGIRFN